MIQNPMNRDFIFDARDDLQLATALTLGDVDLEHPFQALRPAHRLMPLCCALRCLGWPLAPPAQRHLRSQLAAVGDGVDTQAVLQLASSSSESSCR